MAAFNRLPFEALLQIVHQVSITDLAQPHRNAANYPSTFHVTNLARPTLFNLLFVRPFSIPAQCVLNEIIIFDGPYSKSESAISMEKLIARIMDAECGLRGQIRELIIRDWSWVGKDPSIANGDPKYLKHVIFAVEDLRVLKTPKERGLGVEWDQDNLRILNVKFPRLRELNIDLSLKTSGWPLDCFAALAKFSNLQELTIRVLLPSSGPEQSPKASLCHKSATSIFKGFFRHNPDAKLRALHLTVSRWEWVPVIGYVLREVIVGVKRLEGDDHTSPVDGAFDVQIVEHRGPIGSWDRSINKFLGIAD